MWKRTIIYKGYDFIRSWINYVKAKKIVGPVFYSEGFKKIMEKYLKTTLREDWIGRIYGIVNPTVNSKGEFDISTMIIELDGENTNNDNWVKSWLYNQLALVLNLFKMENLYNVINMDIKYVGPENYDNYLIVFDMVARKDFAIASKSFFKSAFFWLIIIGIVLLILNWCGVLV